MPTLLEPDRDQIEIFTDALFRHVDSEGFVSLRAFTHDNKPFCTEAIGLNHGLKPLVDAAQDRARRAAQARESVVFCPPVATFSNMHSATEKDLHEGPALSVELDSYAQHGLETLEAILGLATLVVRSGGRWFDEDGVQHDKLHAHWRLIRPARGEAELAELKQARALATQLAGGDPSNKTIVHPIRWPGSWHRKAEPRLCEIGEHHVDNEIDLRTALRARQAAAPAMPQQPKANGSTTWSGEIPEGWASHIQPIVSGKSYQPALVPLSAKLVKSGMSQGASINMMRALMDSSAGPRDERWQTRYDDIPRIVDSAWAKYHDEPGDDARQIYLPWNFHTGDVVAAPRMLIKHILPETGTGIISGQWGAYKTTIALDLGLSIMTGLNFAGRYRVKRRGGVLYLAPEGAATLTWRLDALAKRTQCEWSITFCVATGLPAAYRQQCGRDHVRTRGSSWCGDRETVRPARRYMLHRHTDNSGEV
jgi:hypothetical protein